MNSEVTEYINSAPKEQREIMETIRKLIHESVPNVSEEFKWSRPVFKGKSDFAYLKTAKAYVTLGFYNFQILDDPKNLLEGTGKNMRHLKLRNAGEIDTDCLRKWFRVSVNSGKH